MNERQWDSCAKEYHDLIISPFQKNARNPIYTDIKKIKNKGRKVLIDLGCGRGDLLPFVKGFKKIYAIDFSKKMLDFARKRHNSRNVKFIKYDARKLSKLNINADLVIAANSILHPDITDVKKTFSEVYKCLKSKGRFIGVFPSMDSVLHNSMLVFEKEYEKYGNEKRALRNARRKSETNKYVKTIGIYDDDGERQKFYYEVELLRRFRDAGFKQIKIKKVIYPWGKESGDYDDFHGEPEMWDWYVNAVKP